MEEAKFWKLITAGALVLSSIAFLVAIGYYKELASAYQQLATCQDGFRFIITP